MRTWRKVNLKGIGKTLILQFIVLSFIVTFSSSFIIGTAQGVWRVAPGLETEYILERSRWTVEVDEESGTGEGGVFQSLIVSEGAFFSVEVLSVDESWGVDFQVSNSSKNSNSYIDYSSFLFAFVKFLYYPVEESERLINKGFDLQQISYGPAIINWFFIEPKEELWDFFDELCTIDYHNSLPNAQEFDLILEATFEIVNENAVFDYFIRGFYENSTFSTQIQINHNLKFVWSASSGILQGYRITSNFEGSYFGENIKEELEVVCREENYNLPSFKFGGLTALFSGLGAETLIISILLLALISALISSKKR